MLWKEYYGIWYHALEKWLVVPWLTFDLFLPQDIRKQAHCFGKCSLTKNCLPFIVQIINELFILKANRCSLKLSHLHLHLSLNREGRRGHHRWRHNQFPPFFSVLHHGNSRARWSPSFSRSNTWPLSSSWNSSAYLALVLEPWRHPPSEAVLTRAISPITGRLVEGGSVWFHPMPTAHWALNIVKF